MIAGLDPHQLALALAAALAAAFVRGLAGFGMALLLIPVLALAVTPGEAVATGNLLGLYIGLVGMRAIVGQAERSAFTIAGLAMAATPLGIWLLSITDAALARFLIALVAAGAFVLVLLPKKPEGHAPSWLDTLTAGLGSGLLTGFAGMPGPPVLPYYLRRRLAPPVVRASLFTIFLATSLAGCVSALALGVMTTRAAALSGMLFPAVLLGNWAGSLAFGKIGDTAWRVFTGAVIGGSALVALAKLVQS